MTDTSELVGLKRRLTDKRRQEWTPDCDKAAQAIERLEQKRVEDYRTMSLALGQQIERAESLEELLAEARAREGRVTSHLCQALGQWQMYAEMQEDCDLSSDDTPEAELYRLAHKVLDGREALAAPAPEPNCLCGDKNDPYHEYAYDACPVHGAKARAAQQQEPSE